MCDCVYVCVEQVHNILDCVLDAGLGALNVPVRSIGIHAHLANQRPLAKLLCNNQKGKQEKHEPTMSVRILVPSRWMVA